MGNNEHMLNLAANEGVFKQEFILFDTNMAIQDLS